MSTITAPPTIAAPPAHAEPLALPAHATRRAHVRALRVVVADDHPMYRQGIVRALETAGAIVVAQASDGDHALALIRHHEPDVALLDVSMPGLDGIDVVAALARVGPDVPTVLLSAFSDEPLVRAGLQAGAASYVPKTAGRDEILRAVGDATAPGLAPRALAGASDVRRGAPHVRIPRLTHVELELLTLARAGVAKPDMALRVGLDEPAVRRALSSAIAKTGADTLPEALEILRDAAIVR